MEKLPETHGLNLKWIGEPGYQILGPTREIYPKGNEKMRAAHKIGSLRFIFPLENNYLPFSDSLG